MAHVKLVARSWGRLPVVLLDEVGAFLDAARREILFDNLVQLGCQVWLTGTDRQTFEALEPRAQFIDTKSLGGLSPLHSL